MKKRDNEDRQIGRRTTSKQDQLVGLLRRKTGAKTDVLMSRLGWQRHTVRAAISRLRKQGHSIEVKRAGGAGGSIYSILVEPSADAQMRTSELV